MNENILGKPVIVTTQNESHARIDRLALAGMKMKNAVRLFSGMEILDYAQTHPVEFVITDWELKDMDVCKFLRHIRREQSTRNIPVVIVTGRNQKSDVLDAISSGCSGYVLRPYSQATMENHLKIAKNVLNYSDIEEEQLQVAEQLVSEGNFDAAIDEFEEIITIEDESQKYFDLGNKYLLEQKYGKAIIAYNKALKINNVFADAFRGLARAYKGKGDGDKYNECLKRAGDIYAQFDRLQEARDVFVEILKNDTKAPNPYNTLGINLRKKGDIPGAIHAYKQALELMPNDENIYYNLSRAYAMNNDLDNAIDSIGKALEISVDFAEASNFYFKLTGLKWELPEGREKPIGDVHKESLTRADIDAD